MYATTMDDVMMVQETLTLSELAALCTHGCDRCGKEARAGIELRITARQGPDPRWSHAGKSHCMGPGVDARPENVHRVPPLVSIGA